MDWLHMLSALVALMLFLYLLVVLFKPTWFGN